MSYTKVRGIIKSEDDKLLLDNITNDKLDKPYLVDAITRIIEDSSSYMRVLSDEKILQLFRLCKEYFNSCFSIFLDISMGGVRLDTLIDYSTSIIYKTDALSGVRISTVNEVKDGIIELIPETIHNIDVTVQRLLNILMWTVTGRIRYFKAAGLQCSFTDNRLNETELQLIYRAGDLLRDLVDWVKDMSEYERAIAILKIAKKKSKYPYPNYAKDEIRADTSIKQAQYICKTRLYGSKLTPDQVEARKIIFKIEKNKYKPLPHEISLLRRIAKELQENMSMNMENDDLPEELAELCNRFYTAEQNGYIRSDDFAFKIISSIQRYKKCSPKQMAVLKRAEETIENNMKLTSTKASDSDAKEGIDTREILDMYNVLDSGLSGTSNGTPDETGLPGVVEI